MIKDFSISLVYLKNNKNNVTYVYECISFWNKEKKRPDSTRTCIGKLDPTSGKITLSKKQVASKEPTFASIKTIGATLLLDHIVKNTGLALVLNQVFPENWNFILSLAYFQTAEGEPLSKVEHWSKTHRHPYESFIRLLSKPQRRLNTKTRRL